MALLAEFFGGKPKTPDFVPIDVQAEQLKAIEGNLASLPAAKETANEVNTFNQEQLLAMLRKAIPGYDDIMAQAGANLNSQLRGEIPQDVADAVKRNAAVKSLYGGFGGSGMADSLQARDLGLTSFEIANRGLDSASRWIAGARAASTPEFFDVSSMFINPQFQVQFAAEERDKKFQRDYIKNQWDWYDSFGQKAARFEDTTVQLASAVLGSMSSSGAMCWVARAVFGERNLKWIMFRHWILTKAPKWFFNLYMKHGERFAAWIENKRILKTILKKWMETRIKNMEVRHG